MTFTSGQPTGSSQMRVGFDCRGCSILLASARSIRIRDHPLHQGLCKASIVMATVGPMHRHRVGGQLWAFIHLAVRHLLDLFVLPFRSERSIEIEQLVLRHEVETLRRQVGRVGADNVIRVPWLR